PTRSDGRELDLSLKGRREKDEPESRGEDDDHERHLQLHESEEGSEQRDGTQLLDLFVGDANPAGAQAANFVPGRSPVLPGPELDEVSLWVDDSRPARADQLPQGAATPVDCQRHAGSDRRCSGESTNGPADPRGRSEERRVGKGAMAT